MAKSNYNFFKNVPTCNGKQKYILIKIKKNQL